MKVNPRKMKLVAKEKYINGIIYVYQNDTNTTAVFYNSHNKKMYKSFVSKHPSDTPNPIYAVDLAIARIKKPFLLDVLKEAKAQISYEAGVYNQIISVIECLDKDFQLTKEVRNGTYVPKKPIVLNFD